MTDPWWLRFPERLEREFRALRDAGFAFERDDAAFAAGVMQLHVELALGDGHIRATATYPDAYPYFKPYVTSPGLNLGHHWNPVTGEICLLASRGGVWRPGSDTLAQLLVEQWPVVLAGDTMGNASGTDAPIDSAATLPPDSDEVDQAEPVTVYVQSDRDSQLIVGATPQLTGRRGTGIVAMAQERPFRGFVTALRDSAGRLAWESAPIYSPPLPTFEAPWVQLGASPADLSPAGVLAAVLAACPELDRDGWVAVDARMPRKLAPSKPHRQVILVAVPEEVARRRLGLGWLAIERTRSAMTKPPGKPHLVRITRAGRDDLYDRAESVRAIGGKRIGVIGGGGLGAAVTLELGRLSPAELTILDGDTVDPATAVRFPGAFRFAAMSKTTALAQQVSEMQPYTMIHPLDGRIGSPRPGGEGDDGHAAVDASLHDLDLLIDATADVGVQHYLADLARQHGVAYMQTEATRGVDGGLIALHRPDAPWCWVCLQHHLTDGTVTPPPASDVPDVQPPGCAEPTYQGTGFDLGVIATMTARVAAAYLTGSHGYGTFEHDVFTVALRDAQARPIPPQWRGYMPARHADCANHR